MQDTWDSWAIRSRIEPIKAVAVASHTRTPEGTGITRPAPAQ